MEAVVHIASWALIVIGSLFYVIGGIGLVRMPDVFTRMHATSVGDTLGVTCLVVGMMLQAGWGLTAARLGFILVILLFAGPIATHALSRAALFANCKPVLAHDRTGTVGDAPPPPRKGPRKPPARAKSAPRKGRGKS